MAKGAGVKPVNIMIDIETLSTKMNAAVVSIGACEFTEDGPVLDDPINEPFYVVIDPQSSIDAGLSIDGSTLLWWLNQNDKARNEFRNFTHDLKTALVGLSEYIEACKRPSAQLFVWGNGAAFDISILESAYHAVGLPLPWRFTNVKCFRTFKSIFAMVEPPESTGVYHRAVDDAICQAQHYSAIFAASKKKK